MSEHEEQPKPPDGLRKNARSLWTAITSAVDMDMRDLVLLREFVRVVDRLDALDRVIKKRGLLLPDDRVHPALVEARQQEITLTRLEAALKLPLDLSEPLRRPQRRGPRGSYLPRLSIVKEADETTNRPSVHL